MDYFHWIRRNQCIKRKLIVEGKAGQWNRRAALAYAFIGCFHKSERFQHLFNANRRFAGLKESHDLFYHAFIAVTVDCNDGLGAKNRSAIAMASGPGSSECADSAIIPNADD